MLVRRDKMVGRVVQAVWRFMKVDRTTYLGPIGLRWTWRSRPVPGAWPWSQRSNMAAPASLEPPASAQGAEVSKPRATCPATSGSGVAVVVGVGPGLGYALVEALQSTGLKVVAVSRNAKRLAADLASLPLSNHPPVLVQGVDATDEQAVSKLMRKVSQELGVPELVVYAVQSFGPGRLVDVEVCAFEDNWRQNCLGAFIVAREAARQMRGVGAGTIVLVGSTSGVIAREDHLNLAVGKFGLRALSQVMARELWREGVHVVHTVIDADIREPGNADTSIPQMLPEDLARMLLHLHQQPRSCWTSEVDFRPWDEAFWKHC